MLFVTLDLFRHREAAACGFQSFQMHAGICKVLFMVTGELWLEDGSFEYVVINEVESG